MKITKLSISNFVCFGDDIEIDFTNKDEIIVLGSINSDSSVSNGAGKSMLLESVYWAITGKFARDSKILDVSRDMKQAGLVSVVFADNKNSIVISRERKGSKSSVTLIIDGDTQTFHNAKEGTDFILKYFHTNPLALQLSCFFGIKYNRFTLLSSNEKMDLIQNALNLSKWDNYKKLASEKMKEANLNLEKVNGQYSVLFARINTIKEKIKDTSQIIDDKTKTFIKGRAKFEQEIADNENILEQSRKDLDDLNKAKVTAEMFLDEHNKSSVVTELSSKEKELIQIKTQTLSELKQNRDASKKIFDDMKKGSVVACPECKRPFLADDINKYKHKSVEITARLEDDSEKLGNKLKLIDDKYDKLESKKKSYSKKRDVLSSALVKARKDFDEFFSAFRELENTVKDLKNKNPQKELEDEIKGLTAVLEHCKAEDVSTQKALVESEKQILVLTEGKDYSSFWYDGFNKIRESVLNKFMIYFTQTIKEMAVDSGLMFDDIVVEVSTSGGEKVKRASLDMYLLRGDDRLPISALSEGESRRFDLCCFYALRQILTDSSPVKFNWVVLDEPLNGLDESGRQYMHELFSKIDSNNQLFIIDHDGNFQGRFQNKVLVKKLNGISFANWE